MPKFHVQLLPRAASDIECIFDFVAERSQVGAKNWFLAFENALSRLAISAESYGLASEASVLDRPVQQCLFKTPHGRTYRLVYLVQDETVWVLRVRGPGQPLLAADEI